MQRVVALVAAVALASGCFGYSSGAKKWSYVGDTVLILGGGGAIAGDLLTHEPCEGVNCELDLPFGGGTVAGVFLVTAGLVGIILTATRDAPPKSSR